MSKVVYMMNVSLDGYVETPDHSLDWAKVDDELHTWFNDRQRESDVSVYGRRLWEVMAAYWPTGEANPAPTEPMREFAQIWNATPKVVFSHELESVEHGARLVRGDVGEELAKPSRSTTARSRFAGRRSPPSSLSAGSSTSTTWSFTRSSSAQGRRSSRPASRGSTSA